MTGDRSATVVQFGPVRVPLASLDIVATVLLAAAALATSWVTYQSARWSGLQAARFTQANTLRTDASSVQTRAGQFIGLDIAMFGAWVTATVAGRGALQRFERARFRDEFRLAFDAWIATDPFHNPRAPATPFVMREYRSRLNDSAATLVAASKEAFADAEAANQQSDLYTFNAVILASVLFFAGIAQQAPRPASRVALLMLAMGGCAIAVVNIVRYPVR